MLSERRRWSACGVLGGVDRHCPGVDLLNFVAFVAMRLCSSSALRRDKNQQKEEKKSQL